jgi:hypothetical protein
MIKSTLRRSIRRAQRHDLIGRNVADLADLPEGQPGRPSRAMTWHRRPPGYRQWHRHRHTNVVVAKHSQAATHAASDTSALACGTKARGGAAPTQVGTDLATITCRSCRSQLGLDGAGASTGRLEALFVLSITLGLRPGELRGLRWDHLDLGKGIIHVWRSARRGGDVKTPKSRRSLVLPKRAVAALTAHKKRQAAELQRQFQSLHDELCATCPSISSSPVSPGRGPG